MADPHTEPNAEPATTADEKSAEEYGTLTAEDADAVTVNPADVAGTADENDDEPPAR